MLVQVKPGDIMEKLLLSAVPAKNKYGNDALYFKCEFHGCVNEADLKSGFTRHLDCEQCVALGIFYRRAIAEQLSPDPLPSGDQVNESLMKACEEAAKGKFDFQPANDRRIIISPVEQERVF